MVKGLLNFLFGKDPDIFDKDGSVRHRLSKEKWDAWHARYMQGDEYNWKNHSGMRAKDITSRKPDPKN